MQPKQPIKDKTILVSSGYGGNTRRPFVMIEAEVLDRPLQLSPDEARALAANLLQAAEGAESDAFIFEFVKNELHQNDMTSAQMLLAYRAWREKEKD